MQKTSVWFDLGHFFFSLVFRHVFSFCAVTIETAVLVRLFFQGELARKRIFWVKLQKVNR